MNEEGGELAILPGGSAIIPADQTDRLMKSYTNNTTNNRSSRSVSFAPSVQITIAGNADQLHRCQPERAASRPVR